jgi:hypothetical protein
MNFTKGILLGSGAALFAVAGAQAADLPSRKSAPVEYVKVCSAYGAGFFFIPGTDTCLKFGGRIRADYGFVPGKTTYNAAGAVVNHKDAVNTLGFEARGALNFDARTNTAYGTVQSTASLRLARVTGVLDQAASASSTSAGATLEYAYVRFAGFTFGAARDNFAYMPSLTYGAGHWGSFANGAKQIAYTATFGGGLSATVALQDGLDTLAGRQSATGSYYAYNTMPQVNANIRLDQAWGTLQVSGAYGSISEVTATNSYNQDEQVWAVGAGLKINLPMLAKGDALYLGAAYADGMTEYTTNWTSFKSSAYKRDVGGYVMNHPSYVAYATGIETVKSWAVQGLLEHYWAPQYRSVLWGTYGQVDGTATSKATVWNGTTGFGDATVWNIGTNFAWLPTRNMEIGVEVIYARVEQDVRTSSVSVINRTDSNVTGRLRVERNF